MFDPQNILLILLASSSTLEYLFWQHEPTVSSASGLDEVVLSVSLKVDCLLSVALILTFDLFLHGRGCSGSLRYSSYSRAFLGSLLPWCAPFILLIESGTFLPLVFTVIAPFISLKKRKENCKVLLERDLGVFGEISVCFGSLLYHLPPMDTEMYTATFEW